MTRGWVGGALLALIIGSAWAAVRVQSPARSQASAPASSARTPVVVELFTSEGCSSCPPADALLSRLEIQQPVAGAEIIALEEHVDYWDQLGWRDPFSSREWTERQRDYAQVFGSASIYTPQMIVNGSAEFVGSREGRGRDAIEDAARRATTPVTVTAAVAPGKHAAEINVQVGPLEGKPGDQPEVWLAVTERGLHSAVSSGENAGEDLHHAAVVRSLQKLGPAARPGTEAAKPAAFDAKVSLDSGWRRENLHVVAFVQERRSLRILGAGRASLAQ
jgi:hypothetical protein